MLFKGITLKSLLFKTFIFLLIWGGSLYAVCFYSPHIIDWEKFATTIFANTLTFLVAYILTIVGFRYSSNEEK